jgi:hypothetical protein
MTSSATQTETEAHGGGEEGLRERLRRWVGTRTEAIAAGTLVVAGWILVLAINRWHVGAPQVFLCLGWLSIVSAGRLLWISAMRAGNELEGEPEEPEPVDTSRAGELEREKRALLKAIKEVEFDRELGKMSDQDADEIVRVYRARAIEIIKLLDGSASALEIRAGEPLDQVIDREVRARLALAGVKARVKASAKASATEVKSEVAQEAHGVTPGDPVSRSGGDLSVGEDEEAKP